MNRYDITLGKKVPEPNPEPESTGQVCVNKYCTIEILSSEIGPTISLGIDGEVFHFLHGKVIVTDSQGNKIEGFMQDMQTTIETPREAINFMGRPVDYVRGMETMRIDMSILVDRRIKAPPPPPDPPPIRKIRDGGL